MKLFAIFIAAAMSVFLAGCNEVSSSTTQKNAQQVENNQQRLQAAQPAPRLDVSLERKNLVERLERLNKQNMSGYIYLLSQGSVVASYPIRGKVTSLNAYLMALEAPQNDPRSGYVSGLPSIMVEQPDYDGAYGKNDDGIFFFTADTNAYVEWKGQYLFSDQPLKLSQQPLMVRQVNE